MLENELLSVCDFSAELRWAPPMWRLSMGKLARQSRLRHLCVLQYSNSSLVEGWTACNFCLGPWPRARPRAPTDKGRPHGHSLLCRCQSVYIAISTGRMANRNENERVFVIAIVYSRVRRMRIHVCAQSHLAPMRMTWRLVMSAQLC
jgi:hypothetical protein